MRRFSQLLTMMRHQSPYPLVVQVGVMLVLCGVPISAWGSVGSDLPLQSFWVLNTLIGLHLLTVLLVPARWLPIWARLLYLAFQCGLTVAVQAISALPLLNLVYLVIVLQAIALLRPLFWIPFAIVVWAVWSGVVLIASMNLVTWVQGNLALAFPALCAIVAVIVYVRHQRGSEQAQQMLQQVQQRYDALATALREMQQLAVQEERRRLSQSLTTELQAALVQAEQLVGQGLEHAQHNLSRLQTTVAQTRVAAATAIERLRGTVALLRSDEAPVADQLIIERLNRDIHDERVLAARASRILTWVLPGVFMAAALFSILLGQQVDQEQLGLIQAVLGLLVLLYVCTQYVQRPMLLQAGLLGQVFALVTMVLLTGSTLFLFGLLLVIWQMALRLSVLQMAFFLLLSGIPLALVISRSHLVDLDLSGWLMVVAVLVLVGGPLLVSRRYLIRRQHAELRAALLEAEVEQQMATVRMLALGNERHRLAREFHDDLGSRLMLLNIQLQLAEELLTENPAAALDQLEQSREQIHDTWRSLLHMIDAGLPVTVANLPESLTELVARCRLSLLLPVELTIEGTLDSLTNAAACTIYRVVQEGLTNACKHARPNWIDARVLVQGGYVTVSIRNDTRSESVAHSSPVQSGGFGLPGLRERAEALGGGLEARMLADGTYRLRVVLPIELDRPDASAEQVLGPMPALRDEPAGIV